MSRYNSLMHDVPKPRITLRGTEALVETFYMTHNVDGLITEDFVSEKEYPLREITVDEIIELRKTHIPSFVLKKGGHYYYTRIHRSMKFTTNMVLSTHLCGQDCAHCYASPDSKGGCQKVRDFDISSYRLSTYGFQKLLPAAKRIEKYDFILEGFESFNTSQCSLVVTQCAQYEAEAPRPKLPPEEVNRRKLAVAQFVWSDVDTLGEARIRYAKLHKSNDENDSA